MQALRRHILMLGAAAAGLLLLYSQVPIAHAQVPFPIPAGLPGPVATGSLIAFAGSNAPQGYILCDGRAVSRTTYSALFGVIGTTYGVGDGTTTFNVPDLRGRAVFGADAMGGTAAGRTPPLSALAASAGQSFETISVAQMPTHAHAVNDPGHAHPASGYAESITSNSFGRTSGLLWTNGDARSGCCVVLGVGASATGVTVAPEGGGVPMSILNPAMAINYLIKN
jgi:microcystin-dependent protein